jgi:uroporphyrinogen decarboxylase
MTPMKRDTLLQRALARKPVERTPVWLMRQAGRYLPEYREVRAEAGGFLEMCRDPALAAEVTLQPIRRFNMDAAIIFSDILLPLDAMGMELFFDERGPVFPTPLRTRADVEGLREVDPRVQLGYVGKALQRVRAALPDRTSLLGFCGAPFTLATYAIEGGTSRSFLELRRVMYREPELWNALMERLTDVVAEHLAFQVASGADAVVLFDTWAGSLTRADWEEYAAPWARRVLERLQGVAPRIVFGGASDHLLEGLADLGAEAVAVDHRTDLARAFERVGDRVALQGNLDPAALLATPEEVTRRTRALLESVRGRTGHVLNLGHGVLKTTDPTCVGAFVEAAREERCLAI